MVPKFKCQICGSEFKTQVLLVSEEYKSGFNSDKIVCPVCLKSYHYDCMSDKELLHVLEVILDAYKGNDAALSKIVNPFALKRTIANLKEKLKSE